MTSIDPLLGPKLKVSRAKRHLVDFETVMREFFATNPYELVGEVDPNTGQHVYRVRVHKCVPDELRIIVGDAVHNLRSALDQLVCALVRANRKQVSGGNGFPIMGSAKRFEEACVGKLKNVSTKADRFIRRLKPYQGGSKPFWLLSELDNMDKHDTLVPVAAGSAQASVQFGDPLFWRAPDGSLCIGGGPEGSVPWGFQHGFWTPDNASVVKVLHDNCEIYRSRVGHLGFPENVQVTAHITFGETKVTENEPIIETLEGLIKLVERTINIVERRVL